LFGKILSDLDCSGELAIHTSGKIPGHVTCHRLHVPRKVRADFLEPVVAHDVLIEGEVRGVLQCTGTVTLARRALLQGLVRAAAIEVRPGASHVGIFDPVSPDGESLAESRKGD
jgi:cytoskeletal protein CcmA (bactofilin family)